MKVRIEHQLYTCLKFHLFISYFVSFISLKICFSNVSFKCTMFYVIDVSGYTAIIMSVLKFLGIMFKKQLQVNQPDFYSAYI